MLYEDTSKPVPGLAEIQTSTKPKGEDKKKFTEAIKEEPKFSDVGTADEADLDTKEEEPMVKGNGKSIMSVTRF